MVFIILQVDFLVVDMVILHLPTNDVIEFITMATLGNATDFGDLTVNHMDLVLLLIQREVYGGGYTPSAKTNVIDFVTIASTGNASDFGDLNTARGYGAGCSDVHGGLGD